jgi:hypothetical protein
MMKRCLLITVLAAGLFVTTASGVETRFEQPMLVTTAGQSVDVKLAGVLLDRLKIKYTASPAATAVDLVGVKTLLIVPGYSSKGLGSAGVSREDELSRVNDLLAAAKKAGIPVLALHLGGKARRGMQSDDFNQLVVEASDLLIVVAQGNEDGFFTKLCQDKQIPLKAVNSMAETMKPLEEVIAK